jgi:PadR family transcriptional regulator, regulatory protein AphA
MKQLSPTARVLLAMIRNGRRTGYEIKQLVDVSTRFFWAASYGQIYPELKRLEQAGLITGEDEPSGGRQRRAYSLTRAGDEALDAWLRSDAEPLYELRDEALLKLFFSNELTDAERLALVRQMRARHEAVVDGLESIAEAAASVGGGTQMTHQYGLGLHRWVIDWCNEQEEKLA